MEQAHTFYLTNLTKVNTRVQIILRPPKLDIFALDT